MKSFAGVKELFDVKLLKFIIVGVINTILGAGTMFLLYNCFNVNYYVCSVCNYVVGGISSYFLNKYFTFKSHSRSKREIFYFIILILVCYLISYPVLKRVIYFIYGVFPNVFSSLSEKAKGNIALLAGEIIYTGLNYIGQRYIVFKDPKKKYEAKESEDE
ncbi:MAG: GtrA family protein [Treponema sp.]|nr:GtrA family protein [Treponema sp.]